MFLFGCQKITISNENPFVDQISSFDDCIQAWFLATDDNPRVCSDWTNIFVEEIKVIEENDDTDEILEDDQNDLEENLEDLEDNESEENNENNIENNTLDIKDDLESEAEASDQNDLTALQQKIKESLEKRNNDNDEQEEWITEEDIDRLESIIDQIIMQ